jgi:hypothetical protein
MNNKNINIDNVEEVKKKELVKVLSRIIQMRLKTIAPMEGKDNE